MLPTTEPRATRSRRPPPTRPAAPRSFRSACPSRSTSPRARRRGNRHHHVRNRLCDGSDRHGRRSAGVRRERALEHSPLTATTPALAAGSANDVVVTNVDGTNGTLVKGFVADFLDGPPANQFHTFITKLVSNSITAGDRRRAVRRQRRHAAPADGRLPAEGQARALLHAAALHRDLLDVPCPSIFAPWIEQMAAEGITGGCGGGNYCPQSPVRRDQMAVFLLKAEHGSAYAPPACAGTFPDVTCPSTFANWIEQLAAEDDHGRLRRRQLLPAVEQHPRTDGGVHLEDVQPAATGASMKLPAPLRRSAAPPRRRGRDVHRDETATGLVAARRSFMSHNAGADMIAFRRSGADPGRDGRRLQGSSRPGPRSASSTIPSLSTASCRWARNRNTMPSHQRDPHTVSGENLVGSNGIHDVLMRHGAGPGPGQRDR